MRKRRIVSILMITCITLAAAIFSSDAASKKKDKGLPEAEVTVFAAASMNSSLQDIIKEYNKKNPRVTINVSADSSGALMKQIEEGAPCDIFFSAAQSNMDELQDKELIVNKSRHNVVNNQLCVITLKGTKTKVKGIGSLNKADSLAIAAASVPVGKYTRQALINKGVFDKGTDPATITTQQLSDALGGVTISEQSNVSKVLSAVNEGSAQVGTTYYSDTYGYDDVKIIQKVPYKLTGNIIYPVARVKNSRASDAEKAAAKDFAKFMRSKTAKKIYKEHLFDTNVKDK